jgi:hypothetical protein
MPPSSAAAATLRDLPSGRFMLMYHTQYDIMIYIYIYICIERDRDLHAEEAEHVVDAVGVEVLLHVRQTAPPPPAQ